MSDKPTLRELLSATIDSFCGQDGFGMPTGFVYCVSRIDEEGQQVLTLGCSDGQSTVVSMGMAAYLMKNFEIDAEQQLTACYHDHDEEDDE